MKKQHVELLARIFLLTLTLSHASTAQQKEIGFVLDVHGAWLIDNKPLHKGQGVPPGATINIVPDARINSDDVWYFSIILLNNESVSRACVTPESCRKPVVLPASIAVTSSLVQRMTDAALRLLSRQAEQYTSTLSRSVDSESTVQDSVVELTGATIDLAQFFGQLESASYQINLHELNRDSAGNSAPAYQTVVARWFADKPSVVPVKCSPGLYELTIVKEHSPAVLGARVEAWILVVNETDFKDVSAAFDQAVRVSDSWGKDVRNDAVRRFRRACLEYLETTYIRR